MTTIHEITCIDCGETFVYTRGYQGGRLPERCEPCNAIQLRKLNREKMARWRKAHPEKAKATYDRHNAKRLADPEHLRQKREREAQRLYGVSADEMRRLFDAQDGRCAICGSEGTASPVGRGKDPTRPRTPLHVDHCHTNGHVRGLLCGHCNTMIGLAREDPAILRAAVRYLESDGK